MTSKTLRKTKAPEKIGERKAAELQKPKRHQLPEFEMGEDGVCRITADTNDQLSELFGGGSEVFVNAMISHCVNVSGKNSANRDDKAYAVAIVAEVGARDGIEAMLATQMAATHIALMRHSRLMAGAEFIDQLDVQEKVFNKLARTFTTQMEALRKHRNGGQQKMTVEHVTVNEGGQAIVGNVETGGGGKSEK